MDRTKDRALVIVDVSNLYYTIKQRFGDKRLDFRKLKTYCHERAWCYKKIAYTSEMLGKADDFFACLRVQGYEVKTKDVKEYHAADGTVKRKANCDIDMVVDAIRYMGHYDELVLVCADADMVPMVQFLQERGNKVHVLGCGIGSEMVKVAHSSCEIGPALLERAHEFNKTN